MCPDFDQVLSRHPRAYSQEKKAEFWTAYQRLGNAAAAAEEVGINPDTATKWIRRWKKRIKAAQETGESAA